jgi:hypothetical protein
MAPDPATAVIVPPPQLPMICSGRDYRPAGNVSVKPTPVNVDALGLLMVLSGRCVQRDARGTEGLRLSAARWQPSGDAPDLAPLDSGEPESAIGAGGDP